jgi:hypothetical protein
LDAGDAVKKRNDLIAWKKQQVNSRGDDENHQDYQSCIVIIAHKKLVTA